MNGGRRGAGPRRIAGAAGRLDIPVPFSLGGLAERLQRQTGRFVRVVPWVMEPGVPAGVLVRAATADYIYCERRTSVFHQVYTVLFLAADLLLGQDTGHDDGTSVDQRLVPDVSPELAGMILGDAPATRVTAAEAETFATLVLDRAGMLDIPPRRARRYLRELRPLYAAVGAGKLETAASPARGRAAAARMRLCQRVIAIRDAMLLLGPYQDPAERAAAMAAACAAGFSGDDLDAAVEAAVIAAAARARSTGRRPNSRTPDGWTPARSGTDLRGEAAWLARVSHALAADLADRHGTRHHGEARAPGGDRPRSR